MSIHAELVNAHKARRAAWHARAVPDPGIDLRRRIDRPAKVDVVTCAATVDVWTIKPVVEPAPPVVKIIPIVCLDKPAKVVITRSKGVLTVPGIVRFIGKRYKLRISTIMGRNRSPKVCRIRFIAIYIAHKITLRSTPDLGRRFGGRDHTSILNALKSVESHMAEDRLFAVRMDSIEAAIRAKAAKLGQQ